MKLVEVDAEVEGEGVVEMEVAGKASRLCDAGGFGGRAIFGRLEAGSVVNRRYRDFIDCQE